MKRYIAVFEVPDDYKPADFADTADGWFEDEKGNLIQIGVKLIEEET